MIARLDVAIKAAGIAIEGVSGPVGGPIRVSPASLQATAQPIIDAFDWSQAAHDAWLATLDRSAATVAIDDDRTPPYKVLRAIVVLLLDEFNALRQWDMSFKAEVASASNLSDLKNRVATLPNLPDRTRVQAITALKAHIDSGSVD
jgi:hypothetical protein